MPPASADHAIALEAAAAAPLGPEQRRVVRGCLIALGILVVGSQIGIAWSPYLLNNHPLWLVGISPLSRHIILVSPVVDSSMLIAVSGARTLAFTALAYWLGVTLGETALVWLEQRSAGATRIAKWMDGFFQRWSYFAVFLFPLGLMACIAGVSQMRAMGFFAAAIPGILFRLSVYVWFGESLREPILVLLEYIRSYQTELTLFLIASIAGYQLYKRRAKQSA